MVSPKWLGISGYLANRSHLGVVSQKHKHFFVWSYVLLETSIKWPKPRSFFWKLNIIFRYALWLFCFMALLDANIIHNIINKYIPFQRRFLWSIANIFVIILRFILASNKAFTFILVAFFVSENWGSPIWYGFLKGVNFTFYVI